MARVRPTLDTVARAAGVSRMTVSNAYNRPDQLSAATRDRVLAVAADLGYPGPDPAGRSLRRGRSATVGLLLSERLSYAFSDPGMMAFLRGLSDVLGPAGQALLLVPAEADDHGSVIRDAIVDAFVVTAMAAEDPVVSAVRDRRLPFVTVGNPRLPKVPYVGVDNRRAGRTALEHLLSLGHRRIAVLTIPGRGPAAGGEAMPARIGIHERVLGARDAATTAGADLRVLDVAANDPGLAAPLVAPLLSLPANRRPTAVFTVTDVLALGVLAAARAASITVPDQLSVIGFDDIPEAAHTEPALTTVSQRLHDQGVRAAEMVLELVAGRPVRSTVFPSELVVRGSTGPSPSPITTPRGTGRRGGRRPRGDR